MTLAQLRARGRAPRVIGFDDAPFDKRVDTAVNVAGVVCAGTRMEGLLWGTATRDGADATEVLAGMVRGSKFHDQLALVLLDGIAIGGMNLVDLPALAEALGLPVVAVMRKAPDLAAFDAVCARFDDAERRRALVRAAGPIHTAAVPFQVAGVDPDTAAWALGALTVQGKVPEALRLAHLIGAAIRTGQSSRRA